MISVNLLVMRDNLHLKGQIPEEKYGIILELILSIIPELIQIMEENRISRVRIIKRKNKNYQI